MTRGHAWAVALAALLLAAVCAGAVLSADRPARLGPFPTRDGDNVVVTPRALR